MKRAIGWVKKYLVKIYEEIQLEIKIKYRKSNGCDNIHQVKKSIEDKISRESPVFFISTGRTGTKFIAKLMKLCKGVRAYHEPEPTLMAVSSELYQMDLSPEVQSLVFRSVRYEVMLKHELGGFRYVESNQTLISLVDGILLAFPNAKIVFIVRHPYSFAQSAYRKGWFANDTVWENNRIMNQCVSNHGQLKTIFHYWAAINSRIIEKSAQYDCCKIIKLEDLTTSMDKITELLQFIEINNVKLTSVENQLGIKVNENKIVSWDHDGMKKTEELPDFVNFKKNNEEFVSNIISPLVDSLNYDL